MSEQELNTYRFTSHEEPTDEMLSQIMKEVAQEAVARQEQAMRRYQEEMERQRVLLHARWDDKLKSLRHG
ncbi:MAG: hypothetical protein K2J57_04155 [Bacteroidales bacterium]|nr:hypothetical protein [Bacteroidales bacterium]